MALLPWQKWLVVITVTVSMISVIVVIVLWQLGVGVFATNGIKNGVTAGVLAMETSNFNPCTDQAVSLQSTMADWPRPTAVVLSATQMSFATYDDTLVCLINPTGNPKDAIIKQYRTDTSYNYGISDAGLIVQARSIAAFGHYNVAYALVPSTGNLNSYTGSTSGGSATDAGSYVRIDNFDPVSPVTHQTLNPVHPGDTPEYLLYRPSASGIGSLYIAWTNPTTTNTIVYSYPVNRSIVTNLPTVQLTIVGKTIKCMHMVANTLILGCPDSKTVYVYQYSNHQWVQQGLALNLNQTLFGVNVRLSPDQLTLAISARTGTNGQIYLYRRSATSSPFVNLVASLNGDVNFGLSLMYIGTSQTLLTGSTTNGGLTIDTSAPSAAVAWSDNATGTESSFLGGGTYSDTKLDIIYDTFAVFDSTKSALLKFIRCHNK